MDRKIVFFAFAASILLCDNAFVPRPYEEFQSNLADDLGNAMAERSVNSRNSSELMEGCAKATLEKCITMSNDERPKDMIEKIGDIDSIQDCQWFCSYIYGGSCNWFVHDSRTRECKIFRGQLDDLVNGCKEKSFSAFPSLSECSSTFNPSSENGCYNFRQDYCRYDMDLITNLEHIENTTYCQIACQNVQRCNFFTYLNDTQVCKLQEANFNNRVCDIVHGTSSPSFQSCLDNDKIPWANASRTYVTSSEPLTNGPNTSTTTIRSTTTTTNTTPTPSQTTMATAPTTTTNPTTTTTTTATTTTTTATTTTTITTTASTTTAVSLPSFTKIERKWCGVSSGNLPPQSNLSEAKRACAVDSNCKGVYDPYCDDAPSFFLCPMTSTYYSSSSSCIYKPSRGRHLAIDMDNEESLTKEVMGEINDENIAPNDDSLTDAEEGND